MKKTVWIPLILALVILVVLFVPIPQGPCNDGGTRSYTALTYKIVDWRRIQGYGLYENTRIYFGADRNKSLDELWQMECEEHGNEMPPDPDPVPEETGILLAEITSLTGDTVSVTALAGQSVTGEIAFSSRELPHIGAEVGSVVKITFTGGVMETYPAQIRATAWEIATDLRPLSYSEPWLDRAVAKKYDHSVFTDIVITKIYADCFFAKTVIPLPYEIKLNGTLSEEWCVGDQVVCTYDAAYYDEKNHRMEVDFITVTESQFEPDHAVAYKPVIYLYPEEEACVSVSLSLDGTLTCTYPPYKDSWLVTASPDGTLTDGTGREYYALFWEGELNTRYDLSRGFCVKGDSSAAFLEKALAELGLTEREANEFILFWLPALEKNPYNVISFQTEAYTDAAGLFITPKPDTLIRVFMTFAPSEVPVSIPPQELSSPRREGFVAVEWGGTQLQ